METINCLDDDSLIEIFSYFNIFERQRLEIVCQRWQSINRRMWRSIRKLKYSTKYIYKKSFTNYIPGGIHLMSNNVIHLGGILKMCNGSLIKLDIDDQSEKAIPFAVCKLFIRNTDLISLRINCINDISFIRYMKFIPKHNIQYLSILSPRQQILETIKTVLKKTRKLTFLSVSGCVTSIIEDVIIGQTTTLTSLCLHKINLCSNLNTIKIYLTNLVSISICNSCKVRDDFLIQISINCRKLRCFKILDSSEFTHVGLAAIATLPKLRYLYLKNDSRYPYRFMLPLPAWEIQGRRYLTPKSVDLFKKLNNDILNNFSNITEIYCNINSNAFTKYQLIQFLRRSPNLKKYNFYDSRCNKLFYELAIKAGMDIHLNKNDRLHNSDWKSRF